MLACRRIQIYPYLSHCTKLKSTWIKGIKSKQRNRKQTNKQKKTCTLNLIEEKVGNSFEGIDIEDNFLDRITTAETL
jgi:hypothetical protein